MTPPQRLLAPGDYRAFITAFWAEPSKTSGQPCLYVEYVLPEQDSRVRSSHSLQRHMLGRVKRLFTRLGLPTPDEDFEVEERDVIGTHVIVTLRVEEENEPRLRGQLRNVVKDVRLAP